MSSQGITFTLTKERANLSRRQGRLKMPETDFFFKCNEDGNAPSSEQLKSVSAEMGSVSLKNGFLNFGAKECYLLLKVSEIASRMCENDALACRGGGFWEKYAILRIKTVLEDIEGALGYSDGGAELDLTNNQYARTAVLIMAADSGVMDLKTDFGNIVFSCKIRNPREEVAKLFYLADRQRYSITEVNIEFYRAVFAFLGGQ